MKQTPLGASTSRALIEKPPLALLAEGDGLARSAAPEAAPAREARIREAAYALFEARGREHGHDLDDWLAAEAALDAAPGQAASDPAAAMH